MLSMSMGFGVVIVDEKLYPAQADGYRYVLDEGSRVDGFRIMS